MPSLSKLFAFTVVVVVIVILTGCRPPAPTPAPFDPSINLDVETQALIARTQRTVFLIPFSHWDTDWHATFDTYSRRADQNILAAIQLAKEHPSFRYTLEQVLFVQHFWETHPESREDLKTLVQNRQITFAWAGITQPETSLAAPGVQLHNLLLGKKWITETFGPDALPSTAWQSDAFGNSAALPLFLDQSDISYLFLGRWQRRCYTGDEDCQPIPHAFYWNSPLTAPGNNQLEPILVASISYSSAWGALLNKKTPEEQFSAFHELIEEQFKRTTSRYLFVPYGFDFLDPSSALLELVEQWNVTNQDTALVISDPETAFHYLASQNLPERTVDLNPIWQAFYGTRPYARIADKESEFYLTATDKFGLFLDGLPVSEWYTTAINAHYDNLGAVGFDEVWEASQRPRFEESVQNAAEDLTTLLANIANQVIDVDTPSPYVLIFNALSWSRSGVVEISGDFPEVSSLSSPQQRTGPDTIAFWVDLIPAIGYSPVISHPASTFQPALVVEEPGNVILRNEFVSVQLDSVHGGTFTGLTLQDQPPVELLAGSSDDLVYLEDRGDVYGAFFGEERARQSQAQAEVEVLAEGPLIARAQVTFSLDGQPITKTITLRAGSPLIEVTLQMKALPETTALMQSSTNIQTDVRTDDLGFAAFEHAIDARPIQPGDITYRREIFYPVTYWSDVSAGNYGLSLITHGLQGIGGTGNLSLLLVRSVSDVRETTAPEGVIDTDLHTFHYAYYPHRGDSVAAQPWKEAYAFNQPLILVWNSGAQLNIQLPFQDRLLNRPFTPIGSKLPESLSLASAENGLIADFYSVGDQLYALVIDYDPLTPATLETLHGSLTLPEGWLWQTPVEIR